MEERLSLECTGPNPRETWCVSPGLLPPPGPAPALAGRRQPAAPLRRRPAAPHGVERRQGVQPGIVPQPREELNPGMMVLGDDQRPDHALEGVAAVEDGQVKPGDDPSLFPDQGDGPFAFGPERLLRPDALGLQGQLGLAEVEPPGDRQEPGRSVGVLQQGPQDDPVMGTDGGGPVRAPGGVLVEGAGAPDVLAGAMDLGVIDGRGPVAVPDPPGGLVDEPTQSGKSSGPPDAVLGEGLEGFPVGDPLDGDDRLGDGVLLGVDGQCGDPLGEAEIAGSGEGRGEGLRSVARWARAV